VARDRSAAHRHLVIDALNVIGSRPNGWWRDRDRAIRALIDRLARFAAAERVAVTVVVDGRPLPDIAEGLIDAIEVLYARRSGRNAADDRIVEEVASDADPKSLVVVTSDRELAARVRDLGARVEGASTISRAAESERQ